MNLLLRLCPDEEDTIYQIVDLLVDTCSTKRKLLRVAGDDKPAEVVRSRFMKLNAQKEVEEYILAEMAATDMLEKKDIRKKAAEAKKKMDKLQHDLPKRRKEIQDEAQAEIDRFNQSQEINPLLLINIVLKF